MARSIRSIRGGRARADAGIPRVKVFLTHAQVADLADAAEPHGLIVRVLAYTGLRWGELAALNVKRVDLTRRRLLVAESMTEVNGKAVFGTPKTHQRRSVPAPRFLVDPLKGQFTPHPGRAVTGLARPAAGSLAAARHA